MDRIYVVHPQVALQIADHRTRSDFMKKEFKENYKYIIGIIYGFIDERKLEICSTTEMVVGKVGDGYEVDEEAYNPINIHHVRNYVGEIELGWYNITPMSDVEINAVNAAFAKKFEVQVRVTYSDDGEHALKLFVPAGAGKWAEVIYKYQSELAEHVGIMQVQSQGDANKQISFTADAYQALDKQLKIIQDFLLKTKEGKIPFHSDLVRRCNDIGLWFNHSRRNFDDEVNIEEGQLALLCGLLAEAMTGAEQKLTKTK